MSEADATILLYLETKNIFRGLYLDKDSKKSFFYIIFLFLSTCSIFIALQVNRKHGCYYTCCFVAYSFIPYGVLNGIVFFQISYRTLLNYFISRVAPELEMSAL